MYGNVSVCLSVAVCDVSLCLYLCISLCIRLCVCLCLYMSVHEYVSVTVCLWVSVYLCIFIPTATFLHFLPLGVRKHEAGTFQRLYFKLGGFMGLWRDPPGTKDEWRCGPLTGYWYAQTRHCHRKGRSHRCLAPPFFAGKAGILPQEGVPMAQYRCGLHEDIQPLMWLLSSPVVLNIPSREKSGRVE